MVMKTPAMVAKHNNNANEPAANTAPSIIKKPLKVKKIVIAANTMKIKTGIPQAIVMHARITAMSG